MIEPPTAGRSATPVILAKRPAGCSPAGHRLVQACFHSPARRRLPAVLSTRRSSSRPIRRRDEQADGGGEHAEDEPVDEFDAGANGTQAAGGAAPGGDRQARGGAAFRPADRGSTAGASCADPQWPVHVCRTRLSGTVIARAIAENGARRARSGAARSQNAGPVDHLPGGSAVAVRRFLEALDRRLHLVGVPCWPVVVGGQPRYSAPTLRPAATSPRTARCEP